MKIIELQLRLDEGERQRMAEQELWNTQKHTYEEVCVHNMLSLLLEVCVCIVCTYVYVKYTHIHTLHTLFTIHLIYIMKIIRPSNRSKKYVHMCII